MPSQIPLPASQAELDQVWMPDQIRVQERVRLAWLGMVSRRTVRLSGASDNAS